MAQLTGRTDIIFHPDLAFSLLQKYCEEKRRSRNSQTQKKFLINIVPLYGHVKEGKLVAAKQYESERPELYASFKLMHASYKSVVRKAITEALTTGYLVETLPFTPMDEAFGKLILEGLNVHHGKYHADVTRMFKKISEADWVFATRYHATIFALKMSIKITPIAYAKKNELLLEELGVERGDFLTTNDLAVGKQTLLKYITVSSEKIAALELMSTSAINKCIDALNVK